MTIGTSVTIGDVTLSEEDLQDGFSAETIFSTPGSRGESQEPRHVRRSSSQQAARQLHVVGHRPAAPNGRADSSTVGDTR